MSLLWPFIGYWAAILASDWLRGIIWYSWPRFWPLFDHCFTMLASYWLRVITCPVSLIDHWSAILASNWLVQLAEELAGAPVDRHNASWRHVLVTKDLVEVRHLLQGVNILQNIWKKIRRYELEIVKMFCSKRQFLVTAKYPPCLLITLRHVSVTRHDTCNVAPVTEAVLRPVAVTRAWVSLILLAVREIT